jgi:hypothetical protein
MGVAVHGSHFVIKAHSASSLEHLRVCTYACPHIFTGRNIFDLTFDLWVFGVGDMLSFCCRGCEAPPIIGVSNIHPTPVFQHSIVPRCVHPHISLAATFCFLRLTTNIELWVMCVEFPPEVPRPQCATGFRQSHQIFVFLPLSFRCLFLTHNCFQTRLTDQ